VTHTAPRVTATTLLNLPITSGAACRRACRVNFFKWHALSTFLRRDWLRVCLLAIVAIAVHSPALQGERIWDDHYLAGDNPFIKSPLLIVETFRHYLFLNSLSAHYRPVQNLSYIVDYFFWNTNTYGFHLTNTLLHAASGILLYFLLRQLFASLFLRNRPIALRAVLLRRLSWISLAAFGVGMMWLVHPVHSAAVDYISGRADSLAFIFCSAGWLLFLRAQTTTRPLVWSALHLLAAICGLLGLLSREIAGIWIALFLIHLFAVEKQVRLRSRFGALACCSLLVAAYLGLRHLPEQQPPSPLDLRHAAPVRAVLMARALGDYGRLMIFPTALHMERTVETDHSAYLDNANWRQAVASEYLSMFGVLVFAGLLFGSVKRGRARPVRVFGAAWFLAAYLPISNIVQLNATAAEHWLYLPSVGFLIFVAGCGVEIATRYRRLAMSCCAVVILCLSARSFLRSSDWSNEETFYTRTFAAGTRSARIAINLAQIYANQRKYAEAEKIFRAVVEQNPNYPTGQNHLASVLYHEGKIKEAEKLFADVEKNAAQTRKQYAHTWIGAVNLAKLRYSDHDDKAALTILREADRDYPQMWEITGLEAEILRQRNQSDAALRLVEAFVHQNWWHYGAALALGQLYAQKGDVHRAEAALRHASRLDVHDAKALNLIAMMRMRENRLDDACRMQRRAVSRQPDEPHQYVLLSDILEKMGREDEARAAIAHASRLRELAQPDTMLLN
jgi:protein O-mannosyl-transferase